MSLEPPVWIYLCALPANPQEPARVRKLVTKITAIKLNFGEWVRSTNSEYPPWSVVEKCKLWASEEWRPFRLALSKPRVIPKVDSSGEKLAIPTLNEMGASPSFMETTEADDANDAMGEMRIFSLGGTRGVPAAAADPPFAAVCTAIAQFFVSMSKFSFNPPPPGGLLPVCPPSPPPALPHPVPMQILVELEDEYMGEVHPLLDTVLGKEVPIPVVGRGKALKFFIDQLRVLDSCDGWQWLSTTTYDKTTGTATMRMVERTVHFGIPHKLGIKVPSFFSYDQGEYKAALPLPVVGWFLKALRVVPSDTRAPEESAWILAVTSNVTMPYHLFKCLTESTCVVVAYTGKYADKPEFMSQLGTTTADMDCFYIVDWQGWFHCIDEGCLCEVAKAQAREEDNSEDDIEQVDALDAPTDAPVASKRKTSGGTPRPPKKKQTPNTPQTPDATSAMDALAAKAKQAKPPAKKGKK